MILYFGQFFCKPHYSNPHTILSKKEQNRLNKLWQNGVIYGHGAEQNREKRKNGAELG